MKSLLSIVLLTLSIALGGFVNATPSATLAPEISAPNGPEMPLVGGWVFKSSDHISGIKTKKKISNPAKIDYDDVLASTAQMKRIEREKIDPKSREGKALRNEAKRAVVSACTTVHQAQRHCGIWKAISHSDGRRIPDVSKLVKDEL